MLSLVTHIAAQYSRMTDSVKIATQLSERLRLAKIEKALSTFVQKKSYRSYHVSIVAAPAYADEYGVEKEAPTVFTGETVEVCV